MKKIFIINYIVLLFFFVIVYGLSLTFIYVEGDDASTIAYHVLGRDPSIQKPYRPYHSMMDLILSVFPAEEVILRPGAMMITALAAILLPILLVILVFDMLNVNSKIPKLLFGILLLLAVPEFFYFGLVFSPTIIAMDLIIIAHILMRTQVFPVLGKMEYSAKQSMRLIGSVFLFGLGVSFRWNLIVYILVIFTDIVVGQTIFSSQQLSKRIKFGIVWSISSFVTIYILIYLTGYRLVEEVIKVFSYSNFWRQLGTSKNIGELDILEVLMRFGLTISTLMTPGFILFCLIGLFRQIKNKSPQLFVLLASLVSVSFYIKSGVPKFIISLLPALVLLFFVGLNHTLSSLNSNRYKIITAFAIGLLFIFPWLFGIEVQMGDSSWGPGFEIKSYDHKIEQGVTIQPVIGAGVAFPTPEGPRPLFGHFYVLFGGNWRKLNQDRFGYDYQIVEEAINLNLPIVITNWSPDVFLLILESKGFNTTDAQDHEADCCLTYVERKFYNTQRDMVITYYSEFEGISAEEIVNRLGVFKEVSPKIIFTGYPSIIRSIFFVCPASMEKLGPNSAIINMKILMSNYC